MTATTTKQKRENISVLEKGSRFPLLQEQPEYSGTIIPQWYRNAMAKQEN
ncbi:hypothetical protein [Akkermansia muciniphila]|nr:hypothetical protein [Akkermansia muciniphila]MBT8778473.1 hypothetical protein [Akkermansia muciniphila]